MDIILGESSRKEDKGSFNEPVVYYTTKKENKPVETGNFDNKFTHAVVYLIVTFPFVACMFNNSKFHDFIHDIGNVFFCLLFISMIKFFFFDVIRNKYENN